MTDEKCKKWRRKQWKKTHNIQQVHIAFTVCNDHRIRNAIDKKRYLPIFVLYLKNPTPIVFISFALKFFSIGLAWGVAFGFSSDFHHFVWCARLVFLFSILVADRFIRWVVAKRNMRIQTSRRFYAVLRNYKSKLSSRAIKEYSYIGKRSVAKIEEKKKIMKKN